MHKCVRPILTNGVKCDIKDLVNKTSKMTTLRSITGKALKIAGIKPTNMENMQIQGIQTSSSSDTRD